MLVVRCRYPLSPRAVVPRGAPFMWLNYNIDISGSVRPPPATSHVSACLSSFSSPPAHSPSAVLLSFSGPHTSPCPRSSLSPAHSPSLYLYYSPYHLYIPCTITAPPDLYPALTSPCPPDLPPAFPFCPHPLQYPFTTSTIYRGFHPRICCIIYIVV